MIDITVPELAESISEASVEAWQVKVGDAVKAGQVLVVIETDKVALDIPAPKDGTITEIVKQDGEDVASNEVLGKIDETATAQASASAPAVPATPAEQAPVADAPVPAPAPSTGGGEATPINVPELAESIAEASVEGWLKQPGDAVNVGEVLVTIETDKVTLEVPSSVAGVLGEHMVKEGEDVTSNQQLTTVIASGAAPAPAPATQAVAASPAPTSSAEQPQTSPAVRKIAHEKNIDLSTVAGSGKDGRITKSDVLTGQKAPAPTTAQSASATATAQAVPAAGGRGTRREKMSKLRAKVAQRLLQSQQETAMLTTFNEADMSAVIGLRQKYRDEFEKRHEIKLGFMSFFVKAVTEALKQHPIINAMIDGKEIVYHDFADVGIAVGSPRGLVVPVLRNAELMSMSDIEKSISDFGKRAQNGTLGIEELAGGTFTITNGGVFGSMMSTPIINPPQSAILGVHATKERAVVHNGEIVIRPMNYLALSYDHRLIDGRDAVLFLVAVKQNLEEPARMVLGL